MLLRCPHCQTRSQIRTSVQVSPVLREMVVVCQDAECGHTFVVHAEAARTLSPSAKPDPDVHLPISDKTRALISQHSSMTGHIQPRLRQPQPASAVPELPRQPGADHRVHRCI